MHLETRTTASVAIIDISGRLEHEAPGPSPLALCVTAILESGSSRFLLDVGRVETADSLTIATLAQAYVTTTRRGGTLKLLHVPPRVRYLLHITKLDRVIEIFDSEDVALASFGLDEVTGHV